MSYLNNALYSKISSKENDCCLNAERVLKELIMHEELFVLDESEVTRSFSLLAESELHRGNNEQTLTYLSLALDKFPYSVILKQNYDYLSSL